MVLISLDTEGASAGGKVVSFPRAPRQAGPNWPHMDTLVKEQSLVNGFLEIRHVDSAALKGNFLDDPSRRPIGIYLPAQYREAPERRFPVIYLLHGAMTDLGSWLKRSTGRKSLLETMDAVMGGTGDAIIVMVDAWTSVGGSQYVNSDAIGRYQDYFVDDVVVWVDRNFRTQEAAACRAVLGHSSGGFGAWMACTRRPGVFGVLGMLAADCLFEGAYLKTLGPAVRRLRAQYGGSMHTFWSAEGTGQRSNQAARDSVILADENGELWDPADAPVYDQHMLAAAFAGSDPMGPRYLFDQDSGQLDSAVWAAWISLDPARTATEYVAELSELRHISIAAGDQDEFFADNGAATLSAKLAEVGVMAFHLTGDDAHAPGDLFTRQFQLAVEALTQR